MKLTEKIIKEFEEKSKILFTRGGLAVLLDYPPHDMILDEEELKNSSSPLSTKSPPKR